jgi:RecA-family ATPase
MKGDHSDLAQALNYIDPATLDYQKWIDVGMALNESGLSCSLWDTWSSKDTKRYHPGECARKWDGFGNGATKVTSGTIVAMARARGWEPHYASAEPDEALGWDDTVQAVSPAWADDVPVDDADEGPWDQAGQISDYLAALFDDDDHVGIVTRAWQRDGRWLPQKGTWSKTAGQLRQELAKCAGDVGKVVGDWPKEAGAWVRINPLDGNGCGNSNVTEYRYSLVESDEVPIERQRGMIEAMNLPCAAIVSSGNKSVHAIVKVDAGTDYDLYRKRVEKLYQYCAGHGFAPDTQNKNPSRLSRLPGVTRNGRRQMLLATSCGAGSWTEWENWVAETEDDLPDTISLADKIENPDPLAKPLIGTEEAGILRHGHKMLVAGPSKAGKSMLLMELATAIASGGRWIGYPCAKGRVLYVNLEIDPASCVMRFKEIADDRHIGVPGWTSNVDLWNLRGHAVPMDELTPRLIHRARGRDYAAVIIDPIYKVITGDENSASEMAAFCNQFDKICAALGTAVIYCHHHSKGAQGSKRSMDRASGSGVFARDPDAMLDIAPIELPDKRASELDGTTCWRVSATLREFATPKPIDLFFRYPVHIPDMQGELARYKVEGEDPYLKQSEQRKKARADQVMADQETKIALVRAAIEECSKAGLRPTRKNVLEQIGEFNGRAVTDGQLKRWTDSGRSKWTVFSLEESNDGGDPIIVEKSDKNE